MFNDNLLINVYQHVIKSNGLLYQTPIPHLLICLLNNENLFGIELQTNTVHAMSLICWRVVAFTFENMAQVAITFSATHLCSCHPE